MKESRSISKTDIDECGDERIHFLQMHLGGDRNFCYLLGDRSTGRAAAVDPGFKMERLAEAAAERNLKIEIILITHAHSDHVGEARKLAQITGAAIHAGAHENMPGALPAHDGQAWSLGKGTIVALHTPGHSPGHLCYLFEKRVITGDLLFCGKVGGTGPYFPGSSSEEEWNSLKRILSLPDEILVFPGHDYYGGEDRMPHSTIGFERRHNPFLLCRSFEEFLELKLNWDAYKRDHNIR